jgi:hypothetical protein
MIWAGLLGMLVVFVQNEGQVSNSVFVVDTILIFFVIFDNGLEVIALL